MVTRSALGLDNRAVLRDDRGILLGAIERRRGLLEDSQIGSALYVAFTYNGLPQLTPSWAQACWRFWPVSKRCHGEFLLVFSRQIARAMKKLFTAQTDAPGGRRGPFVETFQIPPINQGVPSLFRDAIASVSVPIAFTFELPKERRLSLQSRWVLSLKS